MCHLNIVKLTIYPTGTRGHAPISFSILLYYAMLYQFARVLMWVTFKIFFRRIDVTGREKLLHDQPAILIANHPASFLDAMVLAVFLGRSLHFYVRGDIFSHPLVYRILGMLHMIPIYSQEHGAINLVKNKQTFDRGRELLERGQLLLVFPEGFSRLSKQLAPFKKGAARVALQTAFGDGLQHHLVIQTIAINYSYHGFGAQLFIAVGESLSLEPYRDRYHDFPAQAISRLTKDMFIVFERNTIHVRDQQHTALAEALIRMEYRHQSVDPTPFLARAQKICAALAVLDETEYALYDAQFKQYKNRLRSFRLKDIAIAGEINSISIASRMLLFFPFFLLGMLFWGLPWKLAKWIADKTVTRIDFYTSVYAGVLGWLCFIWWTAASLLASQSESGLIFCGILLTPLFAWMARQWVFDCKTMASFVRARRLFKTDPVHMNELYALRKRLVLY